MPRKRFNATDEQICNILDKDFSFPEHYTNQVLEEIYEIDPQSEYCRVKAQ